MACSWRIQGGTRDAPSPLLVQFLNFHAGFVKIFANSRSGLAYHDLRNPESTTSLYKLEWVFFLQKPSEQTKLIENFIFAAYRTDQLNSLFHVMLVNSERVQCYHGYYWLLSEKNLGIHPYYESDVAIQCEQTVPS